MEEWRNVIGYEGVYMVSDQGRVKALARKWVTGKNLHREKGEQILKLILHHTGYMVVTLNNNGMKQARVHTLVARAFIPNPENKPTVNHKDRNRQNNSMNNLEWATFLENNQDTHNDAARKQYGIRNPYSCPITVSKNGTILGTFSTIKSASEALNIQYDKLCKISKGKIVTDLTVTRITKQEYETS